MPVEHGPSDSPYPGYPYRWTDGSWHRIPEPVHEGNKDTSGGTTVRGTIVGGANAGDIAGVPAQPRYYNASGIDPGNPRGMHGTPGTVVPGTGTTQAASSPTWTLQFKYLWPSDGRYHEQPNAPAAAPAPGREIYTGPTTYAGPGGVTSGDTYRQPGTQGSYQQRVAAYRAAPQAKRDGSHPYRWADGLWHSTVEPTPAPPPGQAPPVTDRPPAPSPRASAARQPVAASRRAAGTRRRAPSANRA